jgi:FtsP/CotA-like multicopper oxidase with cupredoxin domain
MTRRRIAWTALAVLALPTAQQPAAAEEARTIAIALAEGAASGPEIEPGPGAPLLRVRQGEPVTLAWTTDADVHLHLHGYDIEFHVLTGTPTALELDPRAAGRFPIATHGVWAGLPDHTAILDLEVHPQ